MKPLLRFIRTILILALVLLGVPLIIEWGMRSWDENNDSYTRKNAVESDAGLVQRGLTRRLFHEIRFRATGFSFKIRATGVDGVNPEEFAEDVTGEISILALEAIDDAKPGPKPPKNATPELSFKFRLKPVSVERQERKFTDFSNVGDVDAMMAYGATVECTLEPISEADAEAISKLESLSFEHGTGHEIDVTLDATVPPETRLIVSYSKSLRSIFRGTFMEWFARSTIGVTP